MTIDEKLAAQTRAALHGSGSVREIKMFGGIGFMLNGNMIAAASDRGLLVRVGKQAEAAALTHSGARVMVMNGRAMSGYIHIERDLLDGRTVKSWVRLARTFVETPPAKKVTAAKKNETAQ